MNTEEFVAVIRKLVRDAAIDDTLDIFESPPGRRPSAELTEISKWYRSLDEHNQALFGRAIAQAVDSAIFGFLCVLDGVRPVESLETSGRFELQYVKKDDGMLLNAPNDKMLHDLYRARLE